MGLGLTLIQRLENSPNQNGVGRYRAIIIPGHIILEQQVNYDPETDQIKQIYQEPTGATDGIAMQHDVDYGVCSNRNEKYGEKEKNCKCIADEKMVKALDAVPWKQRQWGHAAARNTINLKQKLGLGFKQK